MDLSVLFVRVVLSVLFVRVCGSLLIYFKLFGRHVTVDSDRFNKRPIRCPSVFDCLSQQMFM